MKNVPYIGKSAAPRTFLGFGRAKAMRNHGITVGAANTLAGVVASVVAYKGVKYTVNRFRGGKTPAAPKP